MRPHASVIVDIVGGSRIPWRAPSKNAPAPSASPLAPSTRLGMPSHPSLGAFAVTRSNAFLSLGPNEATFARSSAAAPQPVIPRGSVDDELLVPERVAPSPSSRAHLPPPRPSRCEQSRRSSSCAPRPCACASFTARENAQESTSSLARGRRGTPEGVFPAGFLVRGRPGRERVLPVHVLRPARVLARRRPTPGSCARTCRQPPRAAIAGNVPVGLPPRPPRTRGRRVRRTTTRRRAMESAAPCEGHRRSSSPRVEVATRGPQRLARHARRSPPCSHRGARARGARASARAIARVRSPCVTPARPTRGHASRAGGATHVARRRAASPPSEETSIRQRPSRRGRARTRRLRARAMSGARGALEPAWVSSWSTYHTLGARASSTSRDPRPPAVGSFRALLHERFAPEPLGSAPGRRLRASARDGRAHRRGPPT